MKELIYRWRMRREARRHQQIIVSVSLSGHVLERYRVQAEEADRDRLRDAR